MKQLLEKIKAWFKERPYYIDAIITLLVTFLLGLYNIVIGVVAGCVLSLAKEFYRKVKNKDNSSLEYDVLGILVAAIVLILI